ncbi:MAG: 16S rRNA (cytosine(1402)-N(4))-methyltransferase RsmH [Phycisphaerales bacterium]
MDEAQPHDEIASGPGHLPVMPRQVIQLLSPRAGRTMLDCTVGRGGHASLIAPMLVPGGRYIGLDADADNAAFAQRRLADVPMDVRMVHGNFADSREILDGLGVGRIDLLLADLGFASNQMGDAERGFSFQQDAELDMRLDRSGGITAAAMLAEIDERELADILWKYGEERLSRVIARKIIEVRPRSPIHSTKQLAQLCASVYGRRGGRQRIHPATRTFMALRIAVNDELGRLERLLERLPVLMSADSRAVVISFHSLEDRLVKHAFKRYADEGRAELLTRKVVQADDDERMTHPRSRSAKVRAIQWISA